MMHKLYYICVSFIIFGSNMGSLKLYDINIPRESIIALRESIYLNRFSESKIYTLLNLIRISVQLNGGNPLKKPQGKGLIIRKSSF